MSGTQRAVILAAGRGTRMRRPGAAAVLDAEQRAQADRGAKALIPFGGHPYLSYGMAALADAGLRELCVVVGPGADPVRAWYEAARTQRVRLTFAVQEEPAGSAHALLAAELPVAGEPFVVVNADNVYPAAVLARVRMLEGSGLAGFSQGALIAGGIAAHRIASYALLEVDEEGFLTAIREKPGPAEVGNAGRAALVSMTCWRFAPSIFEACRAVGASVRGEYELPDAVAWAVARGERFRVILAEEPVLDLTAREDVARVAVALRGLRADP